MCLLVKFELGVDNIREQVRSGLRRENDWQTNQNTNGNWPEVINFYPASKQIQIDFFIILH